VGKTGVAETAFLLFQCTLGHLKADRPSKRSVTALFGAITCLNCLNKHNNYDVKKIAPIFMEFGISCRSAGFWIASFGKRGPINTRIMIIKDAVLFRAGLGSRKKCQTLCQTGSSKQVFSIIQF
jgi:hypothetical protein